MIALQRALSNPIEYFQCDWASGNVSTMFLAMSVAMMTYAMMRYAKLLVKDSSKKKDKNLLAK